MFYFGQQSMNGLLIYFLGIDSYREGLSTLRSMWDRDIEYPALLRKLRAQYDHYELTIRILFGSITSEAEWTKMTTDPMASRGLWKSKETALQDKLQNAYNSYQSIMAEIEQITKSIASRLDLDGAAEVNTYGMFSASLTDAVCSLLVTISTRCLPRTRRNPTINSNSASVFVLV